MASVCPLGVPRLIHLTHARRGHVLNLRVRKEHLAARLARALRLGRDLTLEFRIDPDPSDAPARRLDPRVRLTRGAIHRMQDCW